MVKQTPHIKIIVLYYKSIIQSLKSQNTSLCILCVRMYIFLYFKQMGRNLITRSSTTCAIKLITKKMWAETHLSNMVKKEPQQKGCD